METDVLLTNRELATAILICTTILVCLIVPRIRRYLKKSALGVLAALFQWKIVAYFSGLVVWAAVLVFVGWQLGWWNLALTLETVFVLVSVGFPMLGRAATMESGQPRIVPAWRGTDLAGGRGVFGHPRRGSWREPECPTRSTEHCQRSRHPGHRLCGVDNCASDHATRADGLVGSITSLPDDSVVAGVSDPLLLPRRVLIVCRDKHPHGWSGEQSQTKGSRHSRLLDWLAPQREVGIAVAMERPRDPPVPVVQGWSAAHEEFPSSCPRR